MDIVSKQIIEFSYRSNVLNEGSNFSDKRSYVRTTGTILFFIVDIDTRTQRSLWSSY